MKALTFLILCFTSIVLADDFKTIDGKEYKNVTVSRVEPDGIVLTTSSGISKVYFTELPKEVQERFHYDTAKAAAYSSEQAASQEALRKQQEELRRKLADENNKYWIGQEPVKNQQDNAKKGQDTCQGLRARYTELQHEEDDLRSRIQEAGRLRKHLYGRSGSKSSDWQKRLSDIRHEKDDVRRQLEQAHCR